MKITGLKKAVGDYKRANAGGPYSPLYGNLMFDSDTGEVWTDTFCDLGHNSWKEYQSDSIVCISKPLERMGFLVTMENVKKHIESNFPNFRQNTRRKNERGIL